MPILLKEVEIEYQDNYIYAKKQPTYKSGLL